MMQLKLSSEAKWTHWRLLTQGKNGRSKENGVNLISEVVASHRYKELRGRMGTRGAAWFCDWQLCSQQQVGTGWTSRSLRSQTIPWFYDEDETFRTSWLGLDSPSHSGVPIKPPLATTTSWLCYICSPHLTIPLHGFFQGKICFKSRTPH